MKNERKWELVLGLIEELLEDRPTDEEFRQMFKARPTEEVNNLIEVYRRAGNLEDSLRDMRLTGRQDGDSVEVMTTAGVIKAYKSMDPQMPGISVILQPAGADVEIDCAYVAVYEDSAIATSLGERPVDVAVMAYGDPYNEDYTDKYVLRREAVMEALEL